MTTDAKPLVFISYKHENPSTKIARKLRKSLAVYSEALGIDVFLDDEDLRASDSWAAEVNSALGNMSHFIALLTDDYWLSAECRRELNAAINRYEDGKKTKLLFVLVEDMRPELLSLNADRKAGRLLSDDPQITKIGDIHFLGPYNDAKQLVRLHWDNEALLGDQLSQLIKHFIRTLPARNT
mgnify:CR=1 FL=1|jgi:hypothetical protein